ncbi:MAG: hypothetical protein J6Y28_05365 [Acholeplasmatales bacterium]|nr:hypothetical protein [Acholeplasmatales bacterium]
MKKIIGVILFLCFAVLLVGCKKKNKYHATVYTNSNDVLSEDFLFNNKIKKVEYHLKNEDGTYQIDEEGYYKTVMDEDAPEERTYIVKDNDTLSTMINSNKVTVDFDTQIVVVNLFYSTYSRDLFISSIKYEDGNAKFKLYDKHKKGLKDSSGPHCRYAFIIMDKLDIKTATFSYSTKEVL